MKSKLFLVLAAILLITNFTDGIIIEDGYTPGVYLEDYEILLMTGGGRNFNAKRLQFCRNPGNLTS